MEVVTVAGFLDYYRRVREATRRVVAVIPEAALDWTYKPGKFTTGDLVRHIAAIERFVFAEAALGRPIRYGGCGKELGADLPAVLGFFDRCHGETLAMLGSLTDGDLQRRVPNAAGRDMELGKLLRALPVHEIHHRGALCIYLNLFGVDTPPVLGLTAEQLLVRSAGGRSERS